MLLERIRDIRASERRFYQKLTDLYEVLDIAAAAVELRKDIDAPEFQVTCMDELRGVKQMFKNG